MQSLKVKVSNLYYYIIALIVLLNTKVFMFGDFESALRYFTAIISIILFLSCIFSRNVFGRLHPFCKKINIWIFLLYFSMFANMVICNHKYGTSYQYMVSQSYLFFYFLLVYPIIYVLISDKIDFERIVKLLFYCGIISYIVRTITWILYNKLGIDFMHYLVFEAGYDWTRRGNQRIPAPCFTIIVVGYALYKIFGSHSQLIKCKYLILYICVCLYDNFILDSRSAVLRELLVFMIIFLIHNRKSKSFYFRLLLIVILIIATLLQNGIGKYINSIDNWSITARLGALDYFWKLYLKYPLTGIQFVSESVSLERGPGNFYYFADLGFLSIFFQFGFIVCGLLLTPIIKFIKVAFSKFTKKDSFFILFESISIYLIVGLCLLDNIYFFRNIFITPFVISFTEYYCSYINKHTSNRLVN